MCESCKQKVVTTLDLSSLANNSALVIMDWKSDLATFEMRAEQLVKHEEELNIPSDPLDFEDNIITPPEEELANIKMEIDETEMRLSAKTTVELKEYICDICSMTFNKRFNIERHLKWHFNIKNFKCPICKKEFVSATNLKRHSVTHTNERPFTCTVCDKPFKLKSQMKDHRRIHTKKAYNCPYCPHSSSNIPDLRLHIGTHAGEKPYPCLQCKTSFKTNYDRVKHKCPLGKNANTMKPERFEEDLIKQYEVVIDQAGDCVDERRKAKTTVIPHKYTCTICSMTFNRKFNIERHLKSHFNIMKYECPICQQKFVNSSNLKRHAIKHSNERPHSCDQCDKSLNTKNI